MELYNLINTYSEKFIPIFIRVAVIFFFIPFIGARMTPMLVKVGFALALTLLLLPVVQVRLENPVKAVFEAVFIGSAVGLAVRIILGAVETAAQWINIEMGFGAAAIFNPLFGEQLGPLSLFYTFLSMGIFFMLDVHHYFIEGIVRSFDMGEIRYKGIFDSIIKLNGVLFPLAFKIAAPILLVQVMINIAMGFISRALPQANIFFISMPLLIFAGVVFVVLSLPLTFMIISKAFTHVKDAIMVFTK
ncbi:MAG: flagellar biosynthetic protein FliR [Nitrospirae bacterium]|nr:flagellar biosynthetic protein FliR [Nitrospirota bacterium]MCL5978638.1 flagellar biosynthetic protein FliR [Nitrospirota bacterium]